MKYEEIILIAYVAFLIIMSIITLALFIKDKRLAIKGSNRIKEKTLLGFSVFGGAMGAFFGRIIAHHKTNKLYFSLVIYLSLLLEALALALSIYMAFWR